jgi:hypothetical protein
MITVMYSSVRGYQQYCPAFLHLILAQQYYIDNFDNHDEQCGQHSIAC